MTAKLIVLTCLLAVANARSIDELHFNISTLATRIIGGHDAKEGAFPHQVSLQLGIPTMQIPFQHFCGGSILSDKWVLTAAHCVVAIQGLPDYTCVAKAGKHDLTSTEDTEQTSIVSKSFFHERYQKNTEEGISPFDVGLLKLDNPFQLNKRVAAISLPELYSEPTGKVILSGWGAMDDNQVKPEMPFILQTVDLEIISRAECNRAVRSLYLAANGQYPSHDLVDDTNVCTGPMTGGISACGGDSGGPLIRMGSNGKPEVVGVVSWGFSPCGIRGAPSVYAKTAEFVSWIREKMRLY